jgi:ferredoxin
MASQLKSSRPICRGQITADVENIVPDGEIGVYGKRNLGIKYCRACELACPEGATLLIEREFQFS